MPAKAAPSALVEGTSAVSRALTAVWVAPTVRAALRQTGVNPGFFSSSQFCGRAVARAARAVAVPPWSSLPRAETAMVDPGTAPAGTWALTAA